MHTSIDTGHSLANATISFDGETLTADTGRMSRCWRWTGHGFLTIGIGQSGTSPSLSSDQAAADWQLPNIHGECPAAAITAITIEESDDEGFTSPHVCATVELHYAAAALDLRLIVWAYPDAPGIRTQLMIRASEGYSWQAGRARHSEEETALLQAELERGHRRLDRLPLQTAGTRRRCFGYYSDTQNRNDTTLDLLFERCDDRPLHGPRAYDWPNACCLESGGTGFALLKESHATVNKTGHDTGTFIVLPDGGLQNLGWGILPNEIDTSWRPAWATWCIAYSDDDAERQRAFKTFDRLRYPVRPDQVRLQSNTWGSSRGWLEHRVAAGEERVLRELDSCRDLGIDILQIDDGWQGDDYEQWLPDPRRYPEGWGRVKAAAEEAGIDLGLWLAAMPITRDDLDRAADDGGFVSYKLDFAVLQSRAFVHGRQHQVQVNWDLTEITPRYGYFFAREFGNIYLENRKPVLPRATTYRPAAVFRDLWHLAHYCNLLKFQGSTQNIDQVDPLFSDASSHRHDYCLAITLMSSPLFFCETQRYDEAARAQLRPLIAAYRQVRSELVAGIINPIGAAPDGYQHSGFASMSDDGRSGFLTCFREPGNEDPEARFTLPGLGDGTIHCENLLDGSSWSAALENGSFTCTIPEAGDYRFLRYRVD